MLVEESKSARSDEIFKTFESTCKGYQRKSKNVLINRCSYKPSRTVNPFTLSVYHLFAYIQLRSSIGQSSCIHIPGIFTSTHIRRDHTNHRLTREKKSGDCVGRVMSPARPDLYTRPTVMAIFFFLEKITFKFYFIFIVLFDLWFYLTCSYTSFFLRFARGGALLRNRTSCTRDETTDEFGPATEGQTLVGKNARVYCYCY